MKRQWLQVVALGLVAVGMVLFQARPAASLGISQCRSLGLAGWSQESHWISFSTQEGEGDSQHSGSKAFYEWLNFAILLSGLFYLLRKPLASYFSNRSVSILKGLEEGRKALEESGEKLKSIEQKLERLNDDIAALRAGAAREMEAEAERMRRQAVTEAERVSESARAQIEAATRAAKIELKAFAAIQATEIAEQMLRDRLDRGNQETLVQRFFEGLNGKG